MMTHGEQAAPGANHVTVVIPTKDRWPVLQQTLHTALAQDHTDLDVVVVDGHSSDGTVGALHALGDPRITVLEEPPRGVSLARNAGIAAAKGPWIAFLDDDDLWAPQKLSAQLAALRADPAATWSCTSAVRVHSRLRLGAPERSPGSGDVVDQILTGNVVPAGASSVLARLDVVQRLGGFDAELSNAADWDMWLRLATTGHLASVDRPMVAYYVHTASMAHDVGRSQSDLEQFVAKHVALSSVRGVHVDRKTADLYFASCYLRAGNRPAAMAIYRRLLGSRVFRPDVFLGLALGVSGVRGRDALDLLARYRMPRQWRREVEGWLGALRLNAATTP